MSLTFLMCSERSGSNFVTKLLNGHSEICGPSAKHIFNPVLRNLFRYEPLEEESNWESLLSEIHALLNVSFSIWERTFTMDDIRKLASRGDIQALLTGIYYEEARAHGKRRLFIKENQLYEIFPFLSMHYPNATYLYQVRDPRDMALSWKKNPAHPGGVIRAARQWKKDQQQYLKLYRELDIRGMAVRIRYEDLISDPQEVLGRLLSMIGISYEERMLAFHQDELTRQNAGTQQAWKNLSRGVLSDNKQKYQSELSDEEIRFVEKCCYHEMKILGYQPDNSLDDLNLITESTLDQFDKKEIEKIPLHRPEGVIKNMKIKKQMYCRPI